MRQAGGGGVPEDEVEADHSLRLGCLAVVQDSGLSLRPHKPTALNQEAVLSSGHLTLSQDWRGGGERRRRWRREQKRI